MDSKKLGGWQVRLPVRQGTQILSNCAMTNTVHVQSAGTGPVAPDRHTYSLDTSICVFASLLAREFPSGQSIASFRLSLKPEDRPRNATAEWRVYTAVPPSLEKAIAFVGYDQLNLPAGIGTHRFSLYFNAVSGALMIRCIADNITVEEEGIKVPIGEGQTRVIRQSVTTIHTDGVIFALELLTHWKMGFDDSYLEEHFANVEDFHMVQLGKLFSKFVEALPGYNLQKSSIASVDVRSSSYMHQTEYTAIQDAIEITTGCPIARKIVDGPCLLNRSAEVLDSSQFQIRIIQLNRVLHTWKTLSNGVSIVPLLIWRLPSPIEGLSAECCVQVMTYRGYSSFADIDWINMAIPVEDKLSLIKQTLVGLQRLHDAGICHRRIDASHLVVVSIDPPRAGIIGVENAIQFDPGSFWEDGFYNSDLVEFWRHPPEFWDFESNCPAADLEKSRNSTYNHSVDLWAWAITIAECIGFPPIWKNSPDRKIDPAYRSIFRSWAIIRGRELDFVNDNLWRLLCLLDNLVHWHEADNTAAEILESACWMDVKVHSMPILPCAPDTPDNDVEMVDAFDETVEIRNTESVQIVDDQARDTAKIVPHIVASNDPVQPASNAVTERHKADQAATAATEHHQHGSSDWVAFERDWNSAIDGQDFSEEE